MADPAENVQHHMRNAVEKATCKSVWIIEDFSRQCKEPITSAEFQVGGGQWYWTIRSNRDVLNYDNVAIELRCLRTDLIGAECYFWFLDDETRRTVRIGAAPSESVFSYSVQKCVSVLQAFQKHLSEDVLTLNFKLTTYRIRKSTLCHNTVTEVQIQGSSLMDDLRRLKASDESSDVVLVAGGKILRAHKFILAMRSPVFRAMFENDMKEKRECEVELVDADAAVVEEMLTFIYTDSSPNIKKMTTDLLLIADKYDLKRLRAMCECELSCNLGVDTVIDVLRMAIKLDATHLRDAAIQFIDVHSHEVRKTAGWKSMLREEPQLLQQIYSAL